MTVHLSERLLTACSFWLLLTATTTVCLPPCLQEVYGSATKSNNNSWLRRKLYEAVGVAPLKANTKGKARKPAASAASRKSGSTAPKDAAAKPRCGECCVAGRGSLQQPGREAGGQGGKVCWGCWVPEPKPAGASEHFFLRWPTAPLPASLSCLSLPCRPPKQPAGGLKVKVKRASPAELPASPRLGTSILDMQQHSGLLSADATSDSDDGSGSHGTFTHRRWVGARP